MSNLRLGWVGVLGVGGLLVGCSGSGGGTSGDGGGATDGHASDAHVSPGDGGGGGHEGGTSKEGGSSMEGGSKEGGPSDGGSCAPTAPDAAGKTYEGVFLLSEVSQPTPTRYSAFGDFYDTISQKECYGTKVGACCYRPASGTAPTPAYAGTITVSDGATTLVTLTAPDYVASSMATTTLTWAPGDTLKVSAAGGAIDAFTYSEVAPAVITGVTPSFTTPVAVSTSKDFVVTWTPNGDACTEISFGFGQEGAAAGDSIGCVADDSVGTITVPKALLSKFTATTGTIVIERINAAETYVTNAAVGLVVANVQTGTTTYGP
jgi:hypothetical protein